jgi:hypothetical protein
MVSTPITSICVASTPLIRYKACRIGAVVGLRVRTASVKNTVASANNVQGRPGLPGVCNRTKKVGKGCPPRLRVYWPVTSFPGVQETPRSTSPK